VAGDGPLEAGVLTVRTTPGQMRLVCRTVLGDLDAIGSLDQRLVPGDRVRLAVDASRTAVIGAGARGSGAP
jgi:hypothetical protein